MVVLAWPVLLLLTACIVTASRNEESHEKKKSEKKNVLLLLTDDQDVLVGGIDHMPILHDLLASKGATFNNAFVHTPICCPSRSSILTGKYLHNGGAINNTLAGNCHGKAWRESNERETFGVLAQQFGGYQTGYVGKYLNQYGRCEPTEPSDCRNRVPKGWNMWQGLIGNSRYYNYKTITSNDGGKNIKVDTYGQDYERDYLPNVVANRTIDMIRAFDGQPWVIAAGFPTPHGPFTPAPQDEGYFHGAQAYRTPNWNTTSNFDKHWMMRRLAPIGPKSETRIDEIYRHRLESLRTIDRRLADFVGVLEQTRQLDNTYIIYTSDNGFQLGQHRLVSDKRQLYEHDIRVPLIVRGPDVPTNSSVDQAVLNIDLAPTILDIVASASGRDDQFDLLQTTMDGRSFLPLINDSREDLRCWRNDFLVSYHGEGEAPCEMFECPPPPPSQYHGGDATNNTYHCVRRVIPERNAIYCRFIDDENFLEYYDLETDPWQMQNAADQLTKDEHFQWEMRLLQLRRCRGEGCRQHDCSDPI